MLIISFLWYLFYAYLTCASDFNENENTKIWNVQTTSFKNYVPFLHFIRFSSHRLIITNNNRNIFTDSVLEWRKTPKFKPRLINLIYSIGLSKEKELIEWKKVRAKTFFNTRSHDYR